MKNESIDNLIYQKIASIVHFIIQTEVSPKLDQIQEQIKFLPTKDEYYNKMDTLVGEIRDMRQEHEIAVNRLKRVGVDF